MREGNPPMIVGAGPVGLAAALFLARQGQPTRLIEMRDAPSRQSKALAVNPRTLSLLAPTGVTQKMLQLGLPIRGVQVHGRGRVLVQLSLTEIHPRFPFMLALSQATSERLLARALQEAGGAVERGVRMVECQNAGDGVAATLEPTAGGQREVVACPWLLAADGAHSTARQQLGVAFDGTTFPDAWNLADVPLRTTLPQDHAHIFYLRGGAFRFMIRVVDDAAIGEEQGPIWRVMGNLPDPLAQLAEAEAMGPPTWTSSFRIAHKVNAAFAVGRVYFAGDSAHVHSPMGARGMNLGVEDAWIFAEMARASRLAEYDALRRPVDRRVVRRVEFMSRVVAGRSVLSRWVRSFVLPSLVKLPFIRRQMLATVAGQDHELPEGLAASSGRGA